MVSFNNFQVLTTVALFVCAEAFRFSNGQLNEALGFTLINNSIKVRSRAASSSEGNNFAYFANKVKKN